MDNNSNKTDEAKCEEVMKNTENLDERTANNDLNANDIEPYENGKTEPEKTSSNSDEETANPSSEQDSAVPVFVPKHKYNEGHWSPLNQTGKKSYDLSLLKQIKDDPLSKNKPDNVPLLETCKIIKEPVTFTPMLRPINDSLFPSFAKGSMPTRSAREPRKDGRSVVPSGKGSAKLQSHSNSGSNHKVIVVSLREDVKLNESANAWKPSRYEKDSVTEEEFKTQQLYQKFRGILNKLTPQKFDTLMERVKTLEINNQKRLQGIIDLIFEKAIDEPNFSEAYAAMCNKLYNLKVPADKATSPDQYVNFRALIISRCQTQFVTDKVNEAVLKLEKELNECSDQAKRKELQLMLEEEHRKIRMRSVGNVRFIGELYKLKMLNAKIMVFCMNHLVEKLEEEKLECLCKLLTTIGEQVEGEVKEQLDAVFKKMQDIVEKKSNKISSRVRFMIQDVIELRRRRWVVKNVIDSSPKMMDQIQKEAVEHHRNIELMNAAPVGGGYRRDEGGRGKRDNRRQAGPPTPFLDNWKPSRQPVDMSKLPKATSPKNLISIKLAPQNAWSVYGSGAKGTAKVASKSLITLPTTTANKYSVLAEEPDASTPAAGVKDSSPAPYHSKGASIERSMFSSRMADFASGELSRSQSVGLPRPSAAASRSPIPATVPEAAVPAEPTAVQKPLPEAKRKSVKSTIDLLLINNDLAEFVADVKLLFEMEYHAGVVTEIVNVALQKSLKDVTEIAKSLLHLVSTGTISPENLIKGLDEIFEFAPDSYIDIPMLYDYLGKIVAPHIEKKHITFAQLSPLATHIVQHGHLFLRAVFKEIIENMGPSFAKSKWEESGQSLKQWMHEEQIQRFIENNKLEFLNGEAVSNDEAKKTPSPSETQSKLLQLMNAGESHDCIRGWVKDHIGEASNQDWFMRSLIQAICEHALFGPKGRDVPDFNPDKMNKYTNLIHDFGPTKEAREANCLIGVQQLIHKLEHPQGLTLEIFQHLQEYLIISLEGFLAWEVSDMELEGKGVMIKALTSFYINLKEADNEDSGSED